MILPRDGIRGLRSLPILRLSNRIRPGRVSPQRSGAAVAASVAALVWTRRISL